ncbi:pirin family protein [Ramlibacter humi]|uniref:Pirin family protein n=1 Tax=Ramlibacter humi TaxID=2530451 RepID=A0A4Z0CBL9_9BURK|nr:pirin family protein [Ramlibacter humi]TFZ08741.1 pirin family protein [Ramlibacter humi]
MPVVQQLIGQEKDLGGGFKVRRLLPAARRRSVGPFVFFDHFGPVTEHPQDQHDVRPHPHIGLATVTYLFEGAMMHRDSLGSVQRIEPGAINWMTAGRGIVHSERKPDELRGSEFTNHGLQLWVALPEALEETEPSFQHTPADAIPEVSFGPARVRVLVGEAFGQRSPVVPASPTVYLDVSVPGGGEFDLPALAPELAVYPVAGEVTIDGEPLAPHQMLVLEPGRDARVSARPDARFVVVGGETVGPRFMYWNFVSSRKERILEASDEWAAQRFPSVPGDDVEFIPLPPTRFTPPEPMS